MVDAGQEDCFAQYEPMERHCHAEIGWIGLSGDHTLPLAGKGACRRKRLERTVEYFQKPSIDLSGKYLIAVFTAFNECERIPFFLSYYRRMGVQHFLAIDNNSTDETKKYLAEQTDSTYFYTALSYVDSNA